MDQLTRMLSQVVGKKETAYIEDVFSTYLYTGNGSTQTITNGIDLAGKGGLVWTKARNQPYSNMLRDTIRGVNSFLVSDLTNQASSEAGLFQSFNSNGFTLLGGENSNQSGVSGTSWTFREQAKFFDVVTYTGNGVAGRTVAHNLGSVPGVIIVKRLNAASAWAIYHRSASNPLDFTTSAAGVQYAMASTFGNGTSGVAPTSSVFTLGSDVGVNANTDTYVAYLFAHDAGGFGQSGSDNVISCGSVTVTGTNQQVTLGWEPQFIILKQTDAVDTWRMYDNMRGMGVGGSSVTLQPSSSNNESTDTYPYINATGFTMGTLTTGTYIYIAIRRGPMRPPTTGTSVFSPISVSAGAGTQQSTSFPIDLQIFKTRNNTDSIYVIDRLRGVSTTSTETSTPFLETNTTSIEGSSSSLSRNWNSTGFAISSSFASLSQIYWNFRRAPGFFDEVCWSNTTYAGNQTRKHNLGVVPELIIKLNRSFSGTSNYVYYQNADTSGKLWFAQGFSSTYIPLTFWSGTISSADQNNLYGADYAESYVAYLFATCPGVSKVGTYTGNGSSQTINCGFTTGARFILIKRTDSTGDWYVWDSARGIISANDPHLSLNTTVAEVTDNDSIDPDSTGFSINQSSATNINVNSATYIFLAIA